MFTGLLEQAKSGEEVAGVLSHEFNHVLERHGLERIVKQLGVVAVIGSSLAINGIGRRHETGGCRVALPEIRPGTRDGSRCHGLQLLHRARIDPAGMITFFSGCRSRNRAGGMAVTHPGSAARAERLKKEMALLPKTVPEPFTFQWETVQASAGAARR